MSQQKRAVPRVPIEIRVEYKRVNAFISDFTRDVSGRGIFIRTEYPLEEGTECLFTLEIPTLAQAVTLRGAVRRAVRSAAADEDEAGMGVEFLFDDEQERQALTRVVDSLMVEHLGNALYQRLARMRNREED